MRQVLVPWQWPRGTVPASASGGATRRRRFCRSRLKSVAAVPGTVSMSLCGRLAVVTGGASGIGRCVCVALASENATVIVADLNLDAANAVAQSLPGSATHRGALVDVGESKSVDELFAHIKDTEPLPVSIVVNCAAIATLSSLVDTTDEDFDNIIRVNLKLSSTEKTYFIFTAWIATAWTRKCCTGALSS
ncbi:hypothetical protein V5799_022744 [Amblyomma americanum]|uniref:Uncharacterized protein n=1 Tax=Amblyomma americanum TaxID=6943 RepID=A0AAQ4FJI4_AMBAM